MTSAVPPFSDALPRGRLYGKNVLEGVFRAGPDEDLFLGELLVAVDEVTGRRYLFRVVDVTYGTEHREPGWAERVAGTLLADDERGEAGAHSLYEQGRRTYRVASCRCLGYLSPEGEFRKPKSLPTQFSRVIAPEESDFEFLRTRMGDLPVGQLRSGEAEVDFEVGIPGSSLAAHVGIFATTGMGKSNLMQVLAGGVLRAQGRYGLLLIDPHGEYRTSLARHPWAGERLRTYAARKLPNTSTLRISLAELTVDDLRTAYEWSRPQEEALFELERFYSGGGASAGAGLAWRESKLLPWAAFGALVTLALPPLAFLSGLARYDSLGVGGYALALFAAAAVLAALAWATVRLHPMLPPLLLIGLALVVLLADVVTGGRLQLNTVLGYSPIVAGRFAGFGNLAAALVAVSAIIVATGAWAVGRLPIAVPAVLLAAVIVIGGHPAFGADVGGVLANVPAFVATVALLAGLRLGWRRALLIAGGTLGVLAVFALVDLARPASSRTHLGRLVARVGDEGWTGLATVLQRKLAANVSILTSSAWAYVIPVAFLFLAFLVWRPQGFLRTVVDRVPGLRACLVGVVVSGVLGFSLNDSGVAVPAMMLAVLLPYLTFLVVRTTQPQPAPGAGTQADT